MTTLIITNINTLIMDIIGESHYLKKTFVKFSVLLLIIDKKRNSFHVMHTRSCRKNTLGYMIKKYNVQNINIVLNNERTNTLDKILFCVVHVIYSGNNISEFAVSLHESRKQQHQKNIFHNNNVVKANTYLFFKNINIYVHTLHHLYGIKYKFC